MREEIVLFIIGVLFLFSVESQECSNNDDLTTDFESGKLCPWIDESQGGARWVIENYDSPWEHVHPQKPLKGRNYLRVNRGSTLSFGVAVLRSPAFPLTNNSIYISFSFWIQSKWPQFTNLELYLDRDGSEKLLTTLSNYSGIVKSDSWRTENVSISNEDSPSSIISLVFYAYCGTDVEDAVAIDDIVIQEATNVIPISTTSSTSSTTATTTSTTSTKIPTTATITSTTSSTSPTTATITSTTSSTIPATTTSTTTSSASPTTATTSITTSKPPDSCPVDVGFTCPNSAESNYSNGVACSKSYYHCKNCNVTKMECEDGKVFVDGECVDCHEVSECDDNKNCKKIVL